MEQDNQQPQDMWEDVDPVEGGPTPPQPTPMPPQPEPTPIPTPMPPAPEPTPQPTPIPPIQPIAPMPAMPTPIPSAPTPEVNPPAHPPRRRGGGTWMWIVLVILILIAGGIYAWQNWDKWFGGEVAQEELPTEEMAKGDVEWQTPVRVADLRIYSSPYPEGAPSHMYRRVGKFIKGKYEGADLVVLTYRPEGPSFFDTFQRFVVKDDGDIVMLAAHSDGVWEGSGLDTSGFTMDESYQIAELRFPPKIANPNSAEQELTLVDYSDHAWFADKREIKPVFTDPELGQVYTDINTQTIPPTVNSETGVANKGGFYLKAPDGTLRDYQLKFPFMPEANITEGIVWSDRTRNTYSYLPHEQGGCGAVNYASVMPDSLMSELQEAGTVSYGSTSDPVYELKDKNHVLLKHVYDMYAQFQNPPASYNDFVKGHPLFFWKDSFGRLLKFQSSQFIAAAECGKPVIYLYPEKEMRVSVKVEPRGGMSYSDPAYGKGWEVVAKPNGELTEIKSGKQYPYLFWEGDGGLYQSPTKGWVVPQAEVSKTIQDKLGQYGLNAKEIADFEEFWLPRMQEAPYYFISFYGTSVMDQIAPLTITPKPDTVIRVLMDFAPLSAPKTVEGYPIRTLPRKGFTVIEWGGVIK